MVLLPFPCWKKPTTTSTALLILTEAYASLTRRSTPALHLQKFHHTRPGCYITVLGGGRGGEGVRWRSWRAWMTNAFFFPLFFYGGNSLLMNAGRVCSAAHQNPEATRHFASYVTPARQSGNNGGNNLDLLVSEKHQTEVPPYSTQPYRLHPFTPHPPPPVGKRVIFKHTDITYLIEIPIVTKHHFCSSGMGMETWTKKKSARGMKHTSKHILFWGWVTFLQRKMCLAKRSRGAKMTKYGLREGGRGKVRASSSS